MTVCVRTALRAMGYVCLLVYAAHGTPEEGGFSDLSVRILRCGYVESPLATGTPRPRLGWQLAGERIGARQTAYQLQSAWTREDLEASRATWDTGRMASDQSQQVRFDGPPPEPRQRTWWRVRAWDEAGLPTPWSDPAWFETGALSMADWGASWVEAPPRQADQPEAAPLFRKEFAVAGPVRQARAYVCGLGYHELYLNGMKVGDGVLEPAQTDYPKRALYVAHDITGLLHPGENAVGLWVGDGWYDQSRMYGNMSYGEPCAIALLEWVLEDGAVTRVVTDGSWKAGWGPVLENNVHLGEVYDARLEVPRWASPGFDDSAWPDAVVRPSPTESLEPQRMPGIRRVEELPAQAVTQPA